MSQVRHFPRYSQKENLVTNNTLLLMSRLHDHDRYKFFRFFAALGDEAASLLPGFGLQFSQQVSYGDGRPDGVIAQESVKVLIETKLGTEFRQDQIDRHLAALSDSPHTHRLLLLLSPSLGAADCAPLAGSQHEGVEILHTSFATLIAAARASLSDHDEEMKGVVDDFEAFCSEGDLLPRDEFTMFVPPCRSSLEDNVRLKLYYCPAERSVRKAKYLGIYAQKAVRAVGQIAKVVTCDVDLQQGQASSQEEQLAEDEQRRIVDAVRSAQERNGWDISHGCRFFLCEEMIDTDFAKTSSGGIMGHRYFDLGAEFGVDSLPPTLREIAVLLRDCHWT